uniref:(northern house mosquito) hypothetical protein n=1 Tax=Culex pipiens TaxID=7175 RepID=A0A8D8GDI9_CULPI
MSFTTGGSSPAIRSTKASSSGRWQVSLASSRPPVVAGTVAPSARKTISFYLSFRTDIRPPEPFFCFPGGFFRYPAHVKFDIGFTMLKLSSGTRCQICMTTVCAVLIGSTQI